MAADKACLHERKLPMRLVKACMLMLAMALMLPATLSAAAPRAPVVLAAASLQESLTEAAAAWTRMGHATPLLSFAASSAIARQIDADAPADLFISADEAWMDDVERNGKLRPGTRRDLLANRLVLIVPATDHRSLTLRKAMSLSQLIGAGRLAMADPDAVPAGLYGKAALTALGVWQDVEAKVVRGENVRAALAFVERGEASFGIVYQTDAMASQRVRIAAFFPADSYPPIRYPAATLKNAASPDTEPFQRFLFSAAGKAIFRRYGFQPLP